MILPKHATAVSLQIFMG